MDHTVTVKQIREISNSSKIAANADVIIDGMLTINNFKILRNDVNGCWVSNPQSEVGGKYYDHIDFLDMELAEEVKKKILSVYHKLLQSRSVVPEKTE